MCWAGAGSQLSLAELTMLEPIFLLCQKIFLFRKCKCFAFISKKDVAKEHYLLLLEQTRSLIESGKSRKGSIRHMLK